MANFDKNYTEDGGYLMNYLNYKATTLEKKRVLQFKVTLYGIEPLVWRRIQVPSDYNFWDLHVAIQDAMGWLDYHLHHFEIKGRRKRKLVHIGIPDFDRNNFGLEPVFPGWEIPVTKHFNDLGVTAKYVYDYGDDWCHTVVLEGYILKDQEEKYPLCVTGARACPLEDCGGVYGYERMLKVLSDTGDEEHEEMKEWVGKSWSPELFNPAEIKFCNPHVRWYNAFLRNQRQSF